MHIYTFDFTGSSSHMGSPLQHGRLLEKPVHMREKWGQKRKKEYIHVEGEKYGSARRGKCWDYKLRSVAHNIMMERERIQSTLIRE